jgi:predicted nucleic acid-binding protein
VKQVFVDTGAWHVLIDRKEPDHPTVVPAFQAHRGRLVTSNFVIDETLTTVSPRLGSRTGLWGTGAFWDPGARGPYQPGG